MNKKVLVYFSSLLLTLGALTGCGGNDRVNCIKKIDDYIYEIEEYKSLDFNGAKKWYAENNDNWSEGGCSAVSKEIQGTRLVGRNMDLNISNKCAYVVRTDITKNTPNTHKTFGLSYTFRDISPDYAEVQEKGISKEFYNLVPFMCDDVVNDAGLHVEINMRHGECWPNCKDKYAVEHTNENSSERIYMFEIPQYFGLHCSTVAEAKEYLKTLDVYSKKNYWNYCFLVTDATGHSELLEFCFQDNLLQDNVYWTPTNEDGVVAQTNFYVNEAANSIEDMITGQGRYDTIMNDIGSVDSKAKLYALMEKIQYSSYYLPYQTCKTEHFDPRSELIGEEKRYSGIEGTKAWIMDPVNEPVIELAFNIMNDYINSLSREEKQNENCYWESTFTEIVDPAAKTIEVRFFENANKMYKITFDGIEKITQIG